MPSQTIPSSNADAPATTSLPPAKKLTETAVKNPEKTKRIATSCAKAASKYENTPHKLEDLDFTPYLPQQVFC